MATNHFHCVIAIDNSCKSLSECTVHGRVYYWVHIPTGKGSVEISLSRRANYALTTKVCTVNGVHSLTRVCNQNIIVFCRHPND